MAWYAHLNMTSGSQSAAASTSTTSQPGRPSLRSSPGGSTAGPYAVALITGGGRRPRLHISNRDACQLAEYVYSDGTDFFWGWAQRIAPVSDLAAAAVAVDRVLKVLGGSR